MSQRYLGLLTTLPEGLSPDAAQRKGVADALMKPQRRVRDPTPGPGVLGDLGHRTRPLGMVHSLSEAGNSPL